MPILKNVLGLDLGSHSIKAVEVRQTLRGFEAVSLRMLPRADQEIPLPDLLDRFIHMHRLTTEHVVAALPGDRISSRRFKFPFRERRRVAQAVPFEAAEHMPFQPESVVVDWELVGEDDSGASVVATVAPRTEVSKLIETLREAGCEPRTLEAEGLVLGNLASVFDLPGTRLLVDLGHRKTTLCVLMGGRAVAARVVPVAGLAITQALAADRGLDPVDAERAKCEDGVVDPARGAAFPGPAKVLDRLAREIVRTLESLEEVIGGSGPEVVDEVTIFGGTAQLPGIDAELAQRTGLRTERLGLPREGHGEGLVAGGAPILFAPAVALALRGTAQARTRMNFRQEEFAVRMDLKRYGRQFRPTAVLAGAVAVLAVVGFGTQTFFGARRAAALEQEGTRLYGEIFPGQAPPADSVTSLREAVRSANDRADFLGVYRGNLSPLDLLTEISKRVPDELDVVIEEISIERKSIRMRMRGKSFEAADRLGAELGKFPAFTSVRIGSIETDRTSLAKRFDVTISLAPPEDRE